MTGSDFLHSVACICLSQGTTLLVSPLRPVAHEGDNTASRHNRHVSSLFRVPY